MPSRRCHSRSSSPVMRKPDSAKKVSSESTPPPVKYPACTEIANQMVKPRQPSSAGQCGLRERAVVELTSPWFVTGVRAGCGASAAHQDRDLLAAGHRLAHPAEAQATNVEPLTCRITSRVARGRKQGDERDVVA